MEFFKKHKIIILFCLGICLIAIGYLFNSNFGNTYQLNNAKSEIEKNVDEQKEINEKKKNDVIEEIQSLSFSDIIADTSNLDQVYSEPTLNVSIKYPKGWTFIDQNKKKKLDGVTFWANDGKYNPPPYIHLEVVDKDMFIEKRFSYKMDLENYKAYYNCLLYTSPSPRDRTRSRMPSSA